MNHKNIISLFIRVALVAFTLPTYARAQSPRHGTVVTEHLASTALRGTKTGLDPNRTIKIYLPPSYSKSDKRYPVVYYFHSINGSADKMFAGGNMVTLLERGFASNAVRELIVVVADYSSPTLGSWYENSSTTGHWLDFTTQELVPFIDEHFHTLRDRNSRGLVGDFVGGRGALVFAMLYPDLFSVVYAMHPVATGTGWVPMASKPNWRTIYNAKTFADLSSDGYAVPYVAIQQAFLPNSDRPPFYCDFFVTLQNDKPVLQVELAKKLQAAFLLDHMLIDRSDNLRRMRGIALDWARYDANQDHVYANQAFTRKLDDLGIEHEAEEYNGEPGSKNWTPDGRFYCRVLPFLNRYLVFE